MSAARQVLERLLRRAESARLRNADEHVSLSMSRASSAREYLALRSLDELERFHAEVALAERAGAIVANREGRSGDGSKLIRLSVADLPALARHLGVTLLDEQAAAAMQALDAWIGRFPVIVDVIESWRQGRKVRGCDAGAAVELALAAKAVAARADDIGHERILRRESVRLFGDSKQLEKLTPWLEILATGEVTATGLSKEEVWSAIGLRREPQPMLLAGIGSVELADVTLPLVRPYLGLPVETVRAVATPAHCLLTVENLASFHDAAWVEGASGVLLLYTGGMPSPAWRAAYARILAGLPAAVQIRHWGDIDEGGYRIAATLAAVAREAGRDLQPWLMSPADLPAAILRAAGTPSPSVLGAMQRWAGRAGWPQVEAALAQQPILLEQESLDPVMPAAASG